MRIEVSGQGKLSKAKAEAIERVTRRVDAARRLFITPIAGQEMIYLGKEAEARAYLSAEPEPVDLTDYPFIASEVGVTAPDAHGVAQVYLNLATQWRGIGSALEGIRLSAGANINSSTSLNMISAAESAALDAIEALLP